jgi:hypothetical protein
MSTENQTLETEVVVTDAVATEVVKRGTTKSEVREMSFVGVNDSINVEAMKVAFDKLAHLAMRSNAGIKASARAFRIESKAFADHLQTLRALTPKAGKK